MPQIINQIPQSHACHTMTPPLSGISAKRQLRLPADRQSPDWKFTQFSSEGQVSYVMRHSLSDKG
jgi:hypothetical protein